MNGIRNIALVGLGLLISFRGCQLWCPIGCSDFCALIFPVVHTLG